MNLYPRESIEFVPVPVLGDGVAVPAANLTLCIVRDTARPATWAAPVELEGKVGLMLPGNLAPGIYRIFAKVTDSPETPVVDCGTIKIT